MALALFELAEEGGGDTSMPCLGLEPRPNHVGVKTSTHHTIWATHRLHYVEFFSCEILIFVNIDLKLYYRLSHIDHHIIMN